MQFRVQIISFGMNSLYLVFCFLLLMIIVLIYFTLTDRLNRFLPLCCGIVIQRNVKEEHKDFRRSNPSIMQESQNTKVAKTGRFFKILWNRIDDRNGLFVKQAQRLPYHSHSDIVDMNALDNRHDILKDKLVKNSSCSICLENFNSDEEIIRLNCSHGYHGCCIFDLAKNMDSSEEIFHCPLCKSHVQFRGLGNNDKNQVKRVNALNYTYYGSIGDAFGRMGSTFV